jgi:hypothetical protein
MKANTSKVQIEAWEAKDKLYELVKHLAPAEQIKKLVSMGKPFSDEIKRLKNLAKVAK